MGKKIQIPVRIFFYVLIGLTILFAIIVITNSYLREMELIQKSARLELLERSFAVHPKVTEQALQDGKILYVYVVAPDGMVVESYVLRPELGLESVTYPHTDLLFAQLQVSNARVIHLEKILRRGREEVGEKQGLIVGMDYTEYWHHEIRSLFKYTFMVIALLGLVLLSFIIWRKWQHVQSEMAENERFIYTGKLSRQIAHEIKNPLGVMQAIIDYTLELSDSRLIKAELVDIGNEIQRLNRLVERIRTFSRTTEPQLDRIYLEQFLHEFVAKVEHRYPGLKGSFEELERDVVILGDRDQLTQVLLNLVQNAEESYLEEVPLDGRKVMLGMRQARKGIEIYVQDWGEPIAREVRGRLFDAFVTSKAQGSGLGLAISKQIVRAHGGEITLQESEELKRFTILLPGEQQ